MLHFTMIITYGGAYDFLWFDAGEADAVYHDDSCLSAANNGCPRAGEGDAGDVVVAHPAAEVHGRDGVVQHLRRLQPGVRLRQTMEPSDNT